MTHLTRCLVCLAPLPRRPWWCRWLSPLPVHTGKQVPACMGAETSAGGCVVSAHTCTEITPGCFRCDLHVDEVRAYVDSLRVTYRGVVHDPDCQHIAGPTKTSMAWLGGERLSDDRPCRTCLPDGIPQVPA